MHPYNGEFIIITQNHALQGTYIKNTNTFTFVHNLKLNKHETF
jgi:hypothetical protein